MEDRLFRKQSLGMTSRPRSDRNINEYTPEETRQYLSEIINNGGYYKGEFFYKLDNPKDCILKPMISNNNILVTRNGIPVNRNTRQVLNCFSDAGKIKFNINRKRMSPAEIARSGWYNYNKEAICNTDWDVMYYS